jgi:ABC-2 type transport system ATP-binding protein
MTDIAIEVRGLTRRFQTTLAVDNLSLSVRRGELFGLVGPDGAGKTTTLRMLAGVLPTSGGDAIVNGLSVAREPEEVKHHIAYMSQRFGLYTDLTVAENLEFYADLYRVPKRERPARLERLYRFSNLEPFRDRLAGQLSGGMKQKLGLSCALIHQPEVLLLDEPTFGVDPISRRDLWLIVHGMVAEGMTAVVSTAYMDEAERFDRMALLHEGSVAALGTPDSLLVTLEGQLLAVGGGELRELRAQILTLPGVREAAIFGDRVHATLESAADRAAAIAEDLRGRGFTDVVVESIAPSLEDVFIDKVGRATVGRETVS